MASTRGSLDKVQHSKFHDVDDDDGHDDDDDGGHDDEQHGEWGMSRLRPIKSTVMITVLLYHRPTLIVFYSPEGPISHLQC